MDFPFIPRRALSLFSDIVKFTNLLLATQFALLTNQVIFTSKHELLIEKLKQLYHLTESATKKNRKLSRVPTINSSEKTPWNINTRFAIFIVIGSFKILEKSKNNFENNELG